MAENLKEASTFIEQGHIRVGPHTITDSSFIVTRNMEDYVTWVDGSKIKRTIMKYNDKLDGHGSPHSLHGGGPRALRGSARRLGSRSGAVAGLDSAGLPWAGMAWAGMA